jgi:predicted amidophosphoribosyltransferase
VEIGRALLGVLLPERCVTCGAGEELLCGACRRRLVVLGGSLCAGCGSPTAWPVERCGECAGRRLSFGSARAAVAYDGAGRDLVVAWKERGLRSVADLAADLVVASVPRPEVEALAFVPGDGDRVGWRGVDTAEELAKALGKRWDLPVARTLARARRVRPQRGLSKAERRANIRTAFRAAGASPAALGLIDDVYTTGATVSAAALELKAAGARRVHVVTFARSLV